MLSEAIPVSSSWRKELGLCQGLSHLLISAVALLPLGCTLSVGDFPGRWTHLGSWPSRSHWILINHYCPVALRGKAESRKEENVCGDNWKWGAFINLSFPCPLQSNQTLPCTGPRSCLPLVSVALQEHKEGWSNVPEVPHPSLLLIWQLWNSCLLLLLGWDELGRGDGTCITGDSTSH